MPEVREDHRAARKRDRDGGDQLELRRVLGREQQRQERIVTRLGRVYAVVAGAFELACPFGHALELHREPGIYFHRARPTALSSEMSFERSFFARLAYAADVRSMTSP